MKTSPIHGIHKLLGARFVEIKGWEMPAHYGDPGTESLYVRKGVGIMDLSHRGKVLVSGKDRVVFLQRVLSQDINRLTQSSGAYAAVLDLKGKVLVYMRIYCDEDSFLIDVEPGLSENLVQIFKHYLFREDVTVEDVTEKYGLITIQGPLSRGLLNTVTRTEIKDLLECAHLDLNVKGMSCRVVRTSYTGEEGYDIYTLWNEIPAVWEALSAKGDTSHISQRNMGGVFASLNAGAAPIPFGLEALETLRIEAGTPVYSADMDEHTIPLEANIEKAISYEKGCYIGQETIARIKFRGHVNRTLTGFCITENVVPEKGDKICKVIHDIEHDIGVITSSCFSPILKRPIALGYIRIEYNEPGEVVYIDRGIQRLTAIVTRPPFYHQK